MGQQSASRLQGDRYQHLYSWLHLLDLLDEHKQLDYVFLEHPVAGAADDVTIHPRPNSSQPASYYQVKWHTDFRSGYTMESFIESTKRSRRSLLQKLWSSWRLLRTKQAAKYSRIWLVSNWQPVSGDVLGQLVRAADRGLKAAFLEPDAPAEYVKWRHKWQEHLQAADADFEVFIQSLRFRLGYASIEELEVEIDEKLRRFGIKTGNNVQAVLLDLVSRWIEEGGRKKKVVADDVKLALTRKNLWANPEAVIVIVHNWARQEYDVQPDFELDWTIHFDHAQRRVPSPEVWNRELLPQLHELEKAISTGTDRIIQLHGSLSLSTALALGFTFPWTANYILRLQHRAEMWLSNVEPDPSAHLVAREEPGTAAGDGLLLVVNVTGDATSEVTRYVDEQELLFRTRILLSPKEGANEFSVRANAYATAFAQHTRAELRRAKSTYGTLTTHLFYFGPQSLAMLIGQKLRSCGDIQLYEYLNPGYTASCVLR